MSKYGQLFAKYITSVVTKDSTAITWSVGRLRHSTSRDAVLPGCRHAWEEADLRVSPAHLTLRAGPLGDNRITLFFMLLYVY